MDHDRDRSSLNMVSTKEDFRQEKQLPIRDISSSGLKMAPRIADIPDCKKVFRGCQFRLPRVTGNKKFVFCRGQNVFWTKRSSAVISGV